MLALLADFSRVLHAAGLPIGPGRLIAAARGLGCIDVSSRDDVYWTLHALWVSDPRQRQVFDEVFHAFWRERRPGLPLAGLRLAALGPKPPLRRVREALHEPRPSEAGSNRRAPADTEREIALSHSDREVLASKDFEQMSAAELERAKRQVAELALRLPPIVTRRFIPDRNGERLDLRATLRAEARSFGAGAPWRTRTRRLQAAPLCLICDVSGSMERYARVMLHFMHALTAARGGRKVTSFVFGTRLSNVTRALRERDVDAALARVGASVLDAAGGTRIGPCLAAFNRQWARRVLGQNAQVLLISDGLDRDAGAGISEAAERLQKSCRRLIWLNPLLRYAGFEPRAAGIRALLPHVDEFRPIHDLDSVAALVRALATPAAWTNQRSRRGAHPHSGVFQKVQAAWVVT